jgi:hypothetical protein
VQNVYKNLSDGFLRGTMTFMPTHVNGVRNADALFLAAIDSLIIAYLKHTGFGPK